MSGPFGVNMTVISGQERSGEIVLAAASFLSMGFLSIDCVCTDRTVREEFLTLLYVFADRAKRSYYESPKDFLQKLTAPGNMTTTGDLFWLALDREGDSRAREILAANGEQADKRVYRSVNRLNLLEREIPPPPPVIIAANTWIEARLRHTSPTFGDYLRQLEQSSRSSPNERSPLPSEEQGYYAWCESLYKALIPWQELIKGIQSDFS